MAAHARLDRMVVALLAMVLIGSAAGAAEPPRGSLPEGVRRFDGAIELRYQGFERVSYMWRSDAEGSARTPPVILEGWVMDAAVKPDGEGLAWAYTLSNIGRDGVAREMGQLEATTDAWGTVLQARVLVDRWSGTAGGGSATYLFAVDDLRFPLCCCPRGVLRMGDVIPPQSGAETMPVSPITNRPDGVTMTRRSVVAGRLDRDGRSLLVIQHSGTADIRTPEGRVGVLSDGYSLLDTRTCLVRHGTWTMRAEAGGKRFVIIHTNEARD